MNGATGYFNSLPEPTHHRFLVLGSRLVLHGCQPTSNRSRNACPTITRMITRVVLPMDTASRTRQKFIRTAPPPPPPRPPRPPRPPPARPPQRLRPRHDERLARRRQTRHRHEHRRRAQEVRQEDARIAQRLQVVLVQPPRCERHHRPRYDRHQRCRRHTDHQPPRRPPQRQPGRHAQPKPPGRRLRQRYLVALNLGLCSLLGHPPKYTRCPSRSTLRGAGLSPTPPLRDSGAIASVGCGGDRGPQTQSPRQGPPVPPPPSPPP